MTGAAACFRIHGCFCFLAFSGLALAEILIPIRAWTNRSGATMSAEVIRIDGDQVTFRKPAGETYVYPLRDLSPGDQRFLEKYRAQRASKKTMTPQALPKSRQPAATTAATKPPEKEMRLFGVFKVHQPQPRMEVVFFIGLALFGLGKLGIAISAFQFSVLWGLASLFIPFGAILFCLAYPDEAKNPVVSYLAGALLMILAVST